MVSASAKPTIILIPGGYNNVGPDPNVDIPAYKCFNNALRRAGYPVVLVPYPSLTHTDPSTTDAKCDACFIRDQVLLPRIEQGEKIILVMHSYGSIPACAAAKGLSVLQHRKVGKMGGVLGMVFISAFIVTEGISIVDGCEGGDLPDWVQQNYPAPGLATPREPVYRFCHELEGPGAEIFKAQVAPHAVIAFKSPSPAPAWQDEEFQGRLAYILCTKDRALPRAAQQGMMDASKKGWFVGEIEGSHFAPFAVEHQEAAKMVVGFVERYEDAEEASA